VVRRKYIPKGGGKLRPLGYRAGGQTAADGSDANLLAIYEVDFLPCSYGYRPGVGAHDAIKVLTDELQFGGHNFVVEADIKGFLDPYSYYTLTVERSSKSCGWLSNTRMRKPFCLPRLTWTTASSPRFTRCMTVWRDTRAGAWLETRSHNLAAPQARSTVSVHPSSECAKELPT